MLVQQVYQPKIILNFFWDDVNQRLRIGNALAGANKLTVNGYIRAWGFNGGDGTVGTPTFRFADDTNTGMFSPFQDEISFTVGGVEAINIDETSGNTTVSIKETLELDGQLLDINNSPGTAGQILSSTATGTDWVNSVNFKSPWLSDDDDLPSESTDTNLYHNGNIGIGDFNGSTVSEALEIKKDGINARFENNAKSTRLDVVNSANDMILEQESTLGNGSIILRTETDNTKEVEFKNTGEIQAKAYGENNASVQVTSTKQPVSGIAVDLNGSFLEVPIVFATGKINSNGTVASIFNATSTKISTNNTAGGGGNANGDYQITFTTSLTNANYIIQLTLLDAAGVGNDDLNISYYDQLTTGFKVNIGDNDNGAGNRVDRDSEFMFTIIRLPGL